MAITKQQSHATVLLIPVVETDITTFYNKISSLVQHITKTTFWSLVGIWMFILVNSKIITSAYTTCQTEMVNI